MLTKVTATVAAAAAAGLAYYYLVVRRQKSALKVSLCATKAEVGLQSAAFVADKIKAVVAAQGSARVIFATGASQFEFLSALVKTADDEPRPLAAPIARYQRTLLLPKGTHAGLTLSSRDDGPGVVVAHAVRRGLPLPRHLLPRRRLRRRRLRGERCLGVWGGVFWM